MSVLSKKTSLLLSAIILAVFMAIASYSVISTSTINVNAVGDVDISVENGKLDISGGGMDYTDGDSAWTAFLEKYQTFIVGVSGIGAVSMIVFFIFNFLKLGASSSNPSERSKVLAGLIWSAIAAAGLGAVTIIVGFFYGSLKN